MTNRAGDPRFTPESRTFLHRFTTGDLADEFALSLAELSDAARQATAGRVGRNLRPENRLHARLG